MTLSNMEDGTLSNSFSKTTLLKATFYFICFPRWVLKKMVQRQ
jgi:hypothetical protein